jgi:alpha-tubulin suppressor-like RCC1 family protein
MPPNIKLVDLKGFLDRYAVLSLTGELYAWGKNAKRLLGMDSARSEEENTLATPALLEKQNEFIVDFEVEENCLLLITAKRTSQSFSDSRRAYWTSLKDSIQLNLKGISNKSRFSSK